MDEYTESLLEASLSDEVSDRVVQYIDNSLRDDTMPYAYHRMLPLLYRRPCFSRFSEGVQAKIKGVYRSTRYRNMMLLYRASRFETLFKEYAPILTKGMGLILLAYDDMGMRPMLDVDMLMPNFPLIRHDDPSLIKAGLSMKTNGVRAFSLTDSQGFEVDIHRCLSEHCTSINVLRLLKKHSVTVTYRDHEYRVLCPEHLLVHVVTHGIFCPSAAYTGRWVLDAINLLKKFDIKPAKVHELLAFYDSPTAFKEGMRQLINLTVCDVPKLDLCKALYDGVIEKSKWISKLVTPTPAIEKASGEQVSRAEWFRRVFFCYLIVPWRLRYLSSFRTYYEFYLYAPGQQRHWLKKCAYRAKIRLAYLLTRYWIPKKY